MNALNPRSFDRSKPLVMARFAQLLEHEVSAGDPITIVDEPSAKGEVTDDIALRLWLSRVAVYAADANPTPIETPEQEAERVVVMEATGGGWYMIRAPWLVDAVKVQGKDAAEEARAAIVERGDTKGVEVEKLGGGWYEVTAPWIDAAIKVKGQDAATTAAETLVSEGPPAGWRPQTAEEKEAAAEQARLLDQARAQAEADAAAAAEQDRLDQEAADKAAADAAAIVDPDPFFDPVPAIPTQEVDPLPADKPEAPADAGEVFPADKPTPDEPDEPVNRDGDVPEF